MIIIQFQNLPIIFRLKIGVKFQMHRKIYKRTEKIFFRVVGNARKKKNPCIWKYTEKISVYSKNFRVFSNARKKIPCIVRNTRKFLEYTEFFLMHGKHRPGEQTLCIYIYKIFFNQSIFYYLLYSNANVLLLFLNICVVYICFNFFVFAGRTEHSTVRN